MITPDARKDTDSLRHRVAEERGIDYHRQRQRPGEQTVWYADAWETLLFCLTKNPELRSEQDMNSREINHSAADLPPLTR